MGLAGGFEAEILSFLSQHSVAQRVN